MPKKVHELAKELGLAPNDLIIRIQELGYGQMTKDSNMEEIDAIAVRNTILNSQKKAETTIVKASIKKEAVKESDQVKVMIKAVDKAIIEAQAKKSQTVVLSKEPVEAPRTTQAPPIGKPVARAQSPLPARPLPVGRPMPKNAVPQRKIDVPQELDKIKDIPAETEEFKEASEVAEMNPAVESAAAMEPTVVSAAQGTEKDVPLQPEEDKIQTVNQPSEREGSVITEDKKEEALEQKAQEKAEAAPEKKPEAKAPAKPPVVPQKVDYTPGIGLKIVRRAQDEPKPIPRAPVEPRKPVEQRGSQAPRPAEDRKPKEYVGKKKEGEHTQPDRTVRTDSPRKKEDFKKKVETKDRVLVYTAPVGGAEKKGRKDKVKEKDKKEKFLSKPMDLTKSAPKKHRRYKDKNEYVAEDHFESENMPEGSVVISVPITVAGFCEQIERTTSDAIMALMKMGIMANINQNLDEDTAVLLGLELGVNVVVNKVNEEVVEEGLELFKDKETDLVSRPPIIAVMGHVDHGKTSLLDAIRKTNVTDKEAGGITQHIGASEVELKGQRLVFLDTPGHEAFTAMRARGAHVTDIAVLVVAADDSVKPQTIESISHAKAAGVPIIVAINKMDKPGANPDAVKRDLSDQGVLVEEWGGDVICVPVSAKTGEGIIQLLEMILLQAEVLELKANPNRLAMGTVIEARLDKNKGPVATLLVLNGTLQSGMSIVAGTCSGKIRAMTNHKGDLIRKAGPARAVEVTGLTEVPEAGDEFNAVKEDKIAREIAESRRIKLREEVMTRNSSITLQQLFSQIEEGEVKELNLIIKADVQGSVGALEQSLEKLHNENVKVKILHGGVGTITESDIMLASTSNAVIIGFNVRPSSAVSAMAEREKVEIRTYRIIYEIIDDIEAAIKGMLDPIFKEVIMGKIQVRETFKVPGAGIIAGAYVLEGKVSRNAQVRLVRDGIVVHEGSISSLKRFKDDAKEVATGFECGIGLEKYNDIKEGDIIEAFAMVEIERK
jgi:translation initiation factor IF-2